MPLLRKLSAIVRPAIIDQLLFGQMPAAEADSVREPVESKALEASAMAGRAGS
jgi:hypothetical protein